MLILFTLILAYLIRNSQNDRFFWVACWPGTVVHEALHYTVGTVLLAKPTEFHVLPNETSDSIVLGYVHFENLTWWNTMPTALAPLLGIPLAWWTMHHIGTVDWSWMGAFKLWILASIVASAMPSRGDISAAVRHPGGFVLWGGVAFLLLK